MVHTSDSEEISKEKTQVASWIAALRELRVFVQDRSEFAEAQLPSRITPHPEVKTD